MIVSKVGVKAYRSIRHLKYAVDPRITVLIGANESGKTNVLRALESFTPGVVFDSSLTCQYSEYYYQGKCPEILLEFTQFTKDNRQKLLRFSEAFKDVESFVVKKDGPELRNYRVLVGDHDVPIADMRKFLSVLPKILFFDDIPLLKNQVEMDDLMNGREAFATERNLLKIGGFQDNFEIIFEDSTRGRRASEEAGRLITEQIRRVWSQEPTIEIKLNVNGRVLYIDISDDTTVFDTPESRSLGFRWYLSFYINFIARTFEAKANEYFFLIDEPGIHLHPAGQKDLTRVLEDLAVKNQLMYTTHSPFMINREFPERVRLVRKDKEGTKIDSNAYRENWKPLRTQIGLTVGDLFFFSDSGLLLELPAKKVPLMKRFGMFRSVNGDEE